MILCYILVLTTVGGVAGLAHGAESFEDFVSAPPWEGFRNRLLPNPLPITRQDFGLVRLDGRPAVGGWVQRSLTPAWIGKVISTRTLNDKLSASGKFAVTYDAGNSGVLFGWFNESSR